MMCVSVYNGISNMVLLVMGIQEPNECISFLLFSLITHAQANPILTETQNNVHTGPRAKLGPSPRSAPFYQLGYLRELDQRP